MARKADHKPSALKAHSYVDTAFPRDSGPTPTLKPCTRLAHDQTAGGKHWQTLVLDGR